MKVLLGLVGAAVAVVWGFFVVGTYGVQAGLTVIGVSIGVLILALLSLKNSSSQTQAIVLTLLVVAAIAGYFTRDDVYRHNSLASVLKGTRNDIITLPGSQGRFYTIVQNGPAEDVEKGVPGNNRTPAEIVANLHWVAGGNVEATLDKRPVVIPAAAVNNWQIVNNQTHEIVVTTFEQADNVYQLAHK